MKVLGEANHRGVALDSRLIAMSYIFKVFGYIWGKYSLTN